MSKKQIPCVKKSPRQAGAKASAGTSLPSARTVRQARVAGRQDEPESDVSGAPPSNTAPDNSNQGSLGFRALRWGVDSLYLSYSGELGGEQEVLLKSLKALAQSDNPVEIGKAQLALVDHIFEVKDRGSSLFPYVLEDGAFRIQLSRPGGRAPMAYVKISAHYLAHVGPVEAVRCPR